MPKMLFLFALLLASGCSHRTLNTKTTANDSSDEIGRIPAESLSCFDIVQSILSESDNKISEKNLDSVYTLLRQLEVPDNVINSVKAYDQSLDIAYKKIMSDGSTSIEKGESVAKFGRSLRAIYAKEGTELSKATINELDFILGRNVLRAERFTKNEFVQVADNVFPIDKHPELTHIDYNSYKQYVISFENKTPPYTEITLPNYISIIDRKDIRAIETHNRFPIYFGHDMTHVRYGLHHESYMPMLFGASRSKNHKRYVLLAALAEGVDRAQYSEERAICGYFKDKAMNLEESIAYVARATDEELEVILENMGGFESEIFRNLVSSYSGWKPMFSSKSPVEGFNGVDFEKQIDEMYLLFKKLHEDPEVKPFYDARKSEIVDVRLR